MTENTFNILNIGDEALDAPTQHASPACGPTCVTPVCFVSDEAPATSAQPNPLGPSPWPSTCYVSDEVRAAL